MLTEYEAKRNYFLINIILVFALNVAKLLLHELSHAIAAWLLGGKVTGIFINMFSGETTWVEITGTMPPEAVSIFYLAGVLGEVCVLFPVGGFLFYNNRLNTRPRLVGYWILMLLILSTGYWAFCAFFCKVPSYDPVGFSTYAQIDRDVVGGVASLPFVSLLGLGIYNTIVVEKKILCDPGKIHTITTIVSLFLVLLPGNIV